MAHTPADFAKAKKTFTVVGIALIAFTCLAYAFGMFKIFDFGPPGATHSDIVAALLLSVIKASLVALVFMHLFHEKGMIYKILAFTFFFAVGLMILTLFTLNDPILEQYDTLKTTEGALLQKP